MKLLVITQKVDLNDDVLGFFHRWVEEFGKRAEKVTVICLEMGEHHFAPNIEVLSLGKESGYSKLRYVLRFYKYIWQKRKAYDAVFVHMNQEYVVLGGLFWRLFGKKIFMWRNHPVGGLTTKIAVWLSNYVFCTSPYAYVAHFKKTSLMPVGIDTEEFRPIGGARLPNSLVFFGRIAPIKKPEVLIDALAMLKQKNLLVAKTALVGNARTSDQAFLESLKERIVAEKLEEYVEFRSGIPHRQAPALLSQFEACINTTPTGSLDKALFEAMACETVVITSNKALSGNIPDDLLFEEGNAESLSHSIESLFLRTSTERRDLGQALRKYVIENHGLNTLMDNLQKKFNFKHE